jgi:uncharacterized protein YgbK (DUF1537 family)
MRVAVIADDLTGASDCGGQLIHFGLDVSVVMDGHADGLLRKDAVILNTDSRSVSGEEAYRRVSEACEWLKDQPFDIVYKKIDSTMRGNIGQEINAISDIFCPDFVIIAPAFPENGRQVIDGVHFLHGKPLHETEVARDPKTPVTDSLIPRLIQTQAGKETGHLSAEHLSQGYEAVVERLKAFKERDISYVTADSVAASDLEDLVGMLSKTGFSFVWAGSAGLMNALPPAYGLQRRKSEVRLPKRDRPVLLVIGSVSAAGRKQLERLLSAPDVIGIEMNAIKILDEATKDSEWQRVRREAGSAIESGSHVALFSSGEVEKTQRWGQEHGYSAVQCSNLISQRLGEAAASIIESFDLRHLFVTGGDTAQQVFQQLKVSEFQLLDEVEPGIPLGKVDIGHELFTVTKAGNFGTEFIMVKAMLKLQGG